jgi:hypothetical protein
VYASHKKKDLKWMKKELKSTEKQVFKNGFSQILLKTMLPTTVIENVMTFIPKNGQEIDETKPVANIYMDALTKLTWFSEDPKPFIELQR